MNLLRKFFYKIKQFFIKIINPETTNDSPKKELRIKILESPDERKSRKDKTENKQNEILFIQKSKGRINNPKIKVIKDDMKICSACQQNIVEGERVAKCKRDSHHLIHYQCISLVNQECPLCGGEINKLGSFIKNS